MVRAPLISYAGPFLRFEGCSQSPGAAKLYSDALGFTADVCSPCWVELHSHSIEVFHRYSPTLGMVRYYYLLIGVWLDPITLPLWNILLARSKLILIKLLQTLFDHLGGFCIFYFAILGLVVGKEFKNEYLGSYLSFLRVLSHFRNSLQMESGVSSGGGLSSLGYRFGSGEAPKPASTKAPANVCVEPVMKEATRPGAAADNPQHSYLKKVPAGVNSNINNYYHADGQNTGNFITSMMHLKIMVMEERSQARDDAYVYIAS
ncbi:uncharacterized protein [Spinacia oleracea]|uniref:Uncharacterized protein isoform X1 n=1 Tax=Spinacia oleracea TaxID=3562 RepID=A0ABM3QUD1_SPIOL|nr:uncharacterized protein LOC110787362 isoform X1 [Spinacia oleracea]